MTDSDVSNGSAAMEMTEGGWDSFGAEMMGDAEPVSLSAILEDPAGYDGADVRVMGEVQTVCKNKGCWMTIADGGEPVRVTFKDYGFFMPLDCEGREVTLDGKFAVSTVPEAEVKHLLEDAGKHAEAEAHMGDKMEYRIEATGVRMK